MPKFKVGDVVKVINKHHYYVGRIGVIVGIVNRTVIPYDVVFDDGELDCYYNSDLELVK